jgi:hypothetical protein
MFREELLYLKLIGYCSHPMLSLTKNTLYDHISDSGLKLVEDEQESDTHRYTVELGYRQNGDLNIDEVTFLESQDSKESRAQVQGETEALDAVIDLLDRDYEIEVEEDAQYIKY